MEEFIGKANLEKELQQMNEAKENLLFAHWVLQTKRG